MCYIGMKTEDELIGIENSKTQPLSNVGNFGTISAIVDSANHRSHFHFCRKCFAREVEFYGEYCDICTTRNLAPPLSPQPPEKPQSWKLAVLVLICLIVVALKSCDFQPVAARADKKNVR